MKRFVTVVFIAGCATGCWSTTSRVRFGPDDSSGATTMGPGRYHFEGGPRVDNCAPGRAHVLTARDELHEWYDRQLRQQPAREASNP